MIILLCSEFYCINKKAAFLRLFTSRSSDAAHWQTLNISPSSISRRSSSYHRVHQPETGRGKRLRIN